MPRRSESQTNIPDERPPWPDQVTESQYDRPDQMMPEDRAAPGQQTTSESEGPEVVQVNVEQDSGQASGALETAQRVGENIGENVATASRAAGEKASSLANTAVNRAQSLASELESFTRRKPFSALAGAFLAGIVAVVLGKRRR
jgi:hypothetical protein